MSQENVPEVNQTPDVEKAPQNLAGRFEELKEKISDKLEELGDKLEDVAEAVSDKAEDLMDKIEDKVEDIKERVEDKVDEIKEKLASKDGAEDSERRSEEPQVDLAALSLAELSDLFDKLSQDDDRMKRYKEAEAIKSAFYKKLSKEKADAGLGPKVDEPSSLDDVVEDVAPAASEEAQDNPFEAIEVAFKGVYSNYKKERAEYNRQLDAQREDNLAKKQAVIEDLKALLEKQEDISSTFPEFRQLQTRWREIGPVPATKFRDLNDTYQFNVEKFYDRVKINRELRDLDFKKNLDAKQRFCEQAEMLAQSDNAVESFRELQKLHEQWKEYGPVAKEYRDSIWDRFKAATAVINKKYQGYFEGQKEKQQENLEAKTKLCEQVEAIAGKEVKSSNEWNVLSLEIEEVQKQWRKIGFATKKDNQKIYDRFRAACDKFFTRKRDYYSQFKGEMNENMDKKLALIEQAEALKDSQEWKKTSEVLISLQKQWKEIGAVPRKKSEQLWKRFRAACDAFFNERDKNYKPENDHYFNLKAKKSLVEEIKAYALSGDAETDKSAAQGFAAKWQSIGYVPFKEKDAVQKAYNDAMQSKFPDFSPRPQRGGNATRSNQGGFARRPLTEKERLVQQYNKLQQDIDTYENNIGFFSASKNSAPLIQQMQERIDASKKQLKELEEKIRNAEAAEAGEGEN